MVTEYDATIPAGKVGVWAGSGSAAVKADNFKVRDMSGFYTVDGRFVEDSGNVRVTGGKLEFYNSDGVTRRAICDAVRMGKGVTQVDLTFRTGIDAGVILHYQDPENFMAAVLFDSGGTVTPALVRYQDGKKMEILAASSTFSLTDNTSYTLKCVLADDPGNAALQELKVYVAGTLRLTTTAVDDAWSAGKVGVFRMTKPSSTTTLQWDNFKCGRDLNADGDVDDAGDYVFANLDFNDPGGGVTWQKLTLAYDNSGNLTSDALLEYRYDGWNRLVGVGHAPCDIADPNQWIASYKYLADNRRCRKVVQNRGVETWPNDGGNTTLDLYYAGLGGAGVSPAEDRNGSNQTVRQYLFGASAEPVWMDVNSVPATGNDADPDVTTGTETDAGDPADERYFFHQDRNWNVVALTEYNSDPNSAANGRVKERYETHLAGRYKRILSAGSSELGVAEIASRVGNPFVGGGGTDLMLQEKPPIGPPKPVIEDPPPGTKTIYCFNPTAFEECDKGCKQKYDLCKDIGNASYDVCMKGANTFLNWCLGGCTCSPPSSLACAAQCAGCQLIYGQQVLDCKAWILGWMCGCEAEKLVCSVGCLEGSTQEFYGTKCPEGWIPWEPGWSPPWK